MKQLARFEKILYLLILIFASLSLFTKDEMFTNFITGDAIALKRIFLLGLNFLIGLKVTSGVISIISSFVEEGDHQ